MSRVYFFGTHYNTLRFQKTEVSTRNYRREFGQYRGVVLVNHYESILLSCSDVSFDVERLAKGANVTSYLHVTLRHFVWFSR